MTTTTEKKAKPRETVFGLTVSAVAVYLALKGATFDQIMAVVNGQGRKPTRWTIRGAMNKAAAGEAKVPEVDSEQAEAIKKALAEVPTGEQPKAKPKAKAKTARKPITKEAQLGKKTRKRKAGGK